MKIKQLKIINQDQSTEIADIGADAVNIDYNDTNVKLKLDELSNDNNRSKNNITDLQTELNTTNSNLELQTSRIDNLAHLDEGSTTGDAELIDARVDNDGNTFTSVGKHVRKVEDNIIDINDISSKTFNEQIIFNDTNKRIFTSEEVTWNAWLRANGEVDTSGNKVGAVTNFIDVIPNEHIIIHGRGCQLAKAYAFYDINKKLVEVEPYEERDHIQYFSLTVPKKAYYIRIGDYNRATTETLSISISKPVLNSDLINAKISSVIKNGNKVVVGDYEDITDTFNIKTGAYHKLDSLVYATTNHNAATTLNNPLLITDFDELYLTSESRYSVRVMTIWDSDFHVLVNLPDSSDPSFDYQKIYSYSRYRINALEIMEKYPTAKYIAFSCFDTTSTGKMFTIERKNNYSSLKDIYEDVEALKEYQEESKPTKGQIKTATDIVIDSDHPGYMNKNSGKINAYTGGDTYLTDMIPINKYPKYWISGRAQYQTCMMALFNENGENLMTGMYNDNNDAYVADREEVDIAALLEDYPTAKYIRFGSYLNSLYIYVWKPYTFDEILTLAQNSNILYGKKWVCCGDSFTAGDYTNYIDEHGKSGRESDAWDPEWAQYKTYCWHIARRNGINLVKDAISGSTMAYSSEYIKGEVEDINYRRPFAYQRYLNIPSDADYITLMFGLNESGTPVGEITDSEPTTVYGAWNKVMEYILENMPYAKVGIIVPDAWLPQRLHDALINISHRWGVSYLDLRDGENIPAQINGKLSSDLGYCARAKELRDAAFKNSESDSHPNVKAQEYRSTIIENWLRSL